MAKIKLTRTIVVEYEVKPEYYPQGLTIEEMAEIDYKNACDDPEITFSMNLKTDDIKYEIIK